jgi:tetratricopeptide (TPR) repeat protein
MIWAYRALRELLWLRSASQSAIGNWQSAIPPARRALELADETARTKYPHESDYVRAHWLLGAAHRVAGQFDEAERHLHEALERCRRINLVEFEGDILIDLTRLRATTGAPDEAQRLAEEARLITERSGYVLQGADAHLELAKLALGFYEGGQSCGSAGRRGSAALPGEGAAFSEIVRAAVQRASAEQRKLAREHAQEARRLATCDGPPDYTYKVAYDEAGELLEQLEGRSGSPNDE